MLLWSYNTSSFCYLICCLTTLLAEIFVNFSSDSKCLFVCVFWCFGVLWWFCMIQHSFVDDRALPC